MPELSTNGPVAPSPAATLLLEASELVEQAYRRASGASRVDGNAVRILKDGAANFAAWFAAIRAARKTVFFENYIIEDDEVGRELAEALICRARCGVKIKMLHDWLGSLAGATRRYWRALVAAGVEVRRFNTPRIDSPVGGLSRDHRKTVSIDGEVAFVTGVCVSRRWLGDPARGVLPWRDTGIEIRGPAVGYVERAFAEVWAAAGGSIPAEELSDPATLPHAGDVSLRVIGCSEQGQAILDTSAITATTMAATRPWRSLEQVSSLPRHSAGCACHGIRRPPPQSNLRPRTRQPPR
jgi:cardiolipin synthase